MRLWTWSTLVWWGCGAAGDRSPDPIDPGGDPAACGPDGGYPAGVEEPMAVGAVIAPYSWPEAIDRATGDRFPLDLSRVPCNVDPNVDWSPADVLLFVSVPAW